MKQGMQKMETAEQYLDSLLSNDEEHDALVEARELLSWVARCAHMAGPAGAKAYFISDEKMTAIRLFVERNSK